MTSNTEPDVLDVSKENIWLFKQNKPSYVVRDILYFLSKWHSGDINRNHIYSILMARGVFKWLKVRRDLIKLKLVWRGHIKYLEMLKSLSGGHQRRYWQGRIDGTQECLKEIRKLCHSERWVAPDFDRDAQKWLRDHETKPTG